MDRLKLTASLLALITAMPALAQTTAPSVGVIGATVPTAEGGANGVVLLRDPADPARSVIAASGELGGLELYGLDGQRTAAIPGGEVYAIDARDDGKRAVIAALDRQAGRLRLFARDYASGETMAIDAKPLMHK